MIKRVFGFVKVRYRRLAKNGNRLEAVPNFVFEA